MAQYVGEKYARKFVSDDVKVLKSCVYVTKVTFCDDTSILLVGRPMKKQVAKEFRGLFNWANHISDPDNNWTWISDEENYVMSSSLIANGLVKEVEISTVGAEDLALFNGYNTSDLNKKLEKLDRIEKLLA